MSKKLFLIDGYALIYRAFFAFGTRPLITKEGFNVSALYGFFTSLFNLIDKESPEYMAVVLDTKEPTFRHKLYPEYKATREKMPDELRNQIPLLYEMIEATGIPMISQEGYEADDLIGAICAKTPDLGYYTYIYSSDKDLSQLVNDKVNIYDPKDHTILDREGVKNKFKLYPEQIRDFLTLVGDTSDNIPGVPKVGKKTAVKLLQQFGSIDGVYENLESVKGNAVRESLDNSRETVKLSSKLVKIETDIPVELDEAKLHVKSFDYEKLADYFYKLTMKRLLEYLEQQQGVSSERTKDDRYDPESYDFYKVEDLDDLKKLVKKIDKAQKFSINYKIEGDHLFNYRFSEISISVAKHQAYFISGQINLSDDLQPSLFDVEESDSMIEILEELEKIFENENIKMIGHDVKMFKHTLKNYGIDLKCKIFDTLLADFLVRTYTSTHSVENIARHYLGHFTINEKNSEYETYISSAETAELLFRSYSVLKEDLGVNDEVEKIFYEMEQPLIDVLFGMERNGVTIDKEILEKISKEMSEAAAELSEAVQTLAGEEFNLDSPKQLSEILFEKLSLKGGRKGKSGTYSTDHAVLKKLAHEGYPIAELLLKYREFTKLNNTYAGGLIKYIYQPSGRIHTTYLQHVASTGRLSSTNPNLQSIPIKNEIGEKIRTAFTVPKGYTLLSADYSQIELRILAHFCHDENLIHAFNNGIDIHSATASKLFGTDISEVSREMRSRAKTANFAVLYGKSKYGLSEDMGISYQEASDFIDLYFSQFSKIKQYIEDTTLFIEQYGYVKTLFGRKREIPEIRSSNKNIKSAAVRAAVNAPIQGTSADIIKTAMIEIDKKMNGHNAKMLLQIHDELVFEVKDEEVESFTAFLKHEMENVTKLEVPLEVNIGNGTNWLEAH